VSPELVGGEQLDPKNRALVGKSYLPLAEAMRSIDDPWEYARATAGAPFKAAASWAGVHSEHAKGGMPNYFTPFEQISGPVDVARYTVEGALSNIPGYDQATRALGGHSLFPDRGAAGFTQSTIGLGLKNAPSASAIRRMLLLKAYNDAVGAGDNRRADALKAYIDAANRRGR